MLDDLIRETPVYQHILKEEREKERKRQHQEHFLSLQDILLAIIQVHFPHLEALAKAQLKLIKDVTVLYNLTRKVSATLTEEEAQQHLLTWQQITTATNEQQEGMIDKPV